MVCWLIRSVLTFRLCLSLEGARISPRFLFLIYAATKLKPLNLGEWEIIELQSLVSIVLMGTYFVIMGSICFFLVPIGCRFSVKGVFTVLVHILFLYWRSRRLLYPLFLSAAKSMRQEWSKLVLEEERRLNLINWDLRTLRWVCLGWNEEQCSSWWLLVGLKKILVWREVIGPVVSSMVSL